MAWELPKWYEEKAQSGKELSMQDTTKQPELANKIVLVDANTEKELLNIFNTRFAKKWWPEIIAEYNNLSENDKVKVIDYYKNLNDKHIKCVWAYITLLNNIKIWLIYVSNFDKTGEIGEIPETVKSAYDFLLELDPKASELFTKDYLEMMNVIDKTLWVIIWKKYLKIYKQFLNINKKKNNIKKKKSNIKKILLKV